MANRAEQYYKNDIIEFKGAFKLNGVEQIPVGGSAKVEIWKVGQSTAVLSSTSATIASTQLQHQQLLDTLGTFNLFFTAEYNGSKDKRTGTIEYVVLKKEAY